MRVGLLDSSGRGPSATGANKLVTEVQSDGNKYDVTSRAAWPRREL